MALEKLRDLADLILKVISIVAILAGGCWAVYQFQLAENTATIMQLTLTSEVQPYGPDTRLLVLHVKPKNIGRTLVKLDKHLFSIVVRKLPSNFTTGHLTLQSLPIYHSENLMKRFSEGYELEPGLEYDELVAFIVQKGSMYSVKSTLELNDGTEVDQEVIMRADDPTPAR
jgi:hypothetical protein